MRERGASTHRGFAARLHPLARLASLAPIAELARRLAVILLFPSLLTQYLFYFGGAPSKGFATLRNVSKLQFFDKIGRAKSVGFWFYSTI